MQSWSNLKQALSFDTSVASRLACWLRWRRQTITVGKGSIIFKTLPCYILNIQSPSLEILFLSVLHVLHGFTLRSGFRTKGALLNFKPSFSPNHKPVKRTRLFPCLVKQVFASACCKNKHFLDV